MQIDFDRGAWIVTCKCGQWRHETFVGPNERLMEVFGRIDSAFQEHIKEAEHPPDP